MFKLRYRVAEQVRCDEYISTGQPGPADREVEFEPDTPEVRAALVELFPGVGRTDGGLYESFDHLLTPEEAKAFVLKAAAEKATKREEERARERQRRAQWEAGRELDAMLSAAETEEALAAALEEARQHPLYDYRQWTSDISKVIDAHKERLAAMRREREKAERLAERARWAEAHGSEHLRRGLAAGYDMQRLYVIERAAAEAPGFVVDFDDKAGWSVRSGPSLAALDELEAARPVAERLGLREPEIVWLTRPPQETVAADEAHWEEEEYEAREAIVIRDFLGKYDLVRYVVR